MSLNLDQLLSERARRAASSPFNVLYSLIFHSVVIAAAWFVPELLAKPPESVDYFTVVVVPPQALGIEEPPPPPPPRVEPPPPEPPPPEPPPPDPEPVPEDLPVLVDKKKQVEAKKPPPPPKPASLPPKPIEPPPKRVGSPFGNPLGATTNQVAYGVEDPNFTYGYYLNRVVAVITANWVRPIMGNLEATVHVSIQRDGTIKDLRIVTPSTESEYDQSALRAVNTSSPLPPLPKSYDQDHLGLNLVFR